MNERLNTSPRETGTSFHDGDRIDTHTANPDLLSLQEVRRQRERDAFATEARRLMDAQTTAEQAPRTPQEQLGTIAVTLKRWRDEFDQAA